MATDTNFTASERRRIGFETIAKIRRGNPTTPMGVCMYWSETCSGTPIGSHSLSKCWLETIAVKGHVVVFAPPESKRFGEQEVVVFAPDLVGWKEASVFRGFCNHHDTELFKSLDSLDFQPTQENCVRLVYRSMCREISAKQHASRMIAESEVGKDKKVVDDFLAPEILRCLDLLARKGEVEEALVSGNFSDYESLVFELNSPPRLTGTTTFIPHVTARRRVLEPKMEWLTLTILPTKDAGFAILTWNRWDGKNSALFAHALRRTGATHVGAVIPRVLFEVAENVVFSPFAWLEMPEPVRQVMVDRHKDSIVRATARPIANSFDTDPDVDRYLALAVKDFFELIG